MCIYSSFVHKKETLLQFFGISPPVTTELTLKFKPKADMASKYWRIFFYTFFASWIHLISKWHLLFRNAWHVWWAYPWWEIPTLRIQIIAHVEKWLSCANRCQNLIQNSFARWVNTFFFTLWSLESSLSLSPLNSFSTIWSGNHLPLGFFGAYIRQKLQRRAKKIFVFLWNSSAFFYDCCRGSQTV